MHSLSPIAAADLPQEVAPLIAELNRLLARLAEAFDAQRAFVADAAHELRSPLTALKLQLQLLARAPDDAARDEARGKLGAAIERSMHLVEQLLTLARSESDGSRSPTATVGARRGGALGYRRRAYAGRCARHRREPGRTASRHGSGRRRCAARARAQSDRQRDPLRACQRFRSGARIRGTGGRGTLQVDDSGPGIPPAERERAFDRFYRRDGSPEGGSGLGLAIVKAIAGRHGAAVTLGESPLGGLRVAVSFPAPQQA